MRFLSLTAYGIILLSCNDNNKTLKETSTEKTVKPPITNRVENASNSLREKLTNYEEIVTINHSALADEQNAYTPPSIVSIFSNNEVNTELLKINPLIGLDLPFKVLVFSQPDTNEVWVAYTSSYFIKKRHHLSKDQIHNYKKHINEIAKLFPSTNIITPDISNVSKGFGIVKIKSDLNYESTIESLKNIVNAQPDTQWFGEIDFNKKSPETKLPRTNLLLFGGPAPGAKAMHTCPMLGLDAFCQKLLVYENKNNEVYIAYNDIEAFAQLYCDEVTPPQKMINQRLFKTFSEAVKLEK